MVTREKKLTENQRNVLDILKKFPNSAGTLEIAEKMHLPVAATNSILGSLERAGYVERHHIQVEGPLEWKIKKG